MIPRLYRPLEMFSDLTWKELRLIFASAIPNSFKLKIGNGTIDLDGDDIRTRLCMTNTTCDTEVDAINFVANYTTIDVCDATGYADVALTAEAFTVDDANDRAEFDAADASFTGLGGDAIRATQGVLVYVFITNDAASLPICFIDFTTDIPTTATQTDIPWDAEGILQLT